MLIVLVFQKLSDLQQLQAGHSKLQLQARQVTIIYSSGHFVIGTKQCRVFHPAACRDLPRQARLLKVTTKQREQYIIK